MVYHIEDAASLFLDVGYDFGLTDIDDSEGEGSAKNGALLVSVGVDFPMG